MLDSLGRRFVRVGRLSVTDAGGRTHLYGDGSGPAVSVRLAPGAVRRLLLNPELAIGECYMDGLVVIEQGRLYDLLELFLRNVLSKSHRKGALTRLREAARWLQQMNDPSRARRNVAHHYDLSCELYRRFLDDDLQYSCAYFAEAGMSLEQAQAAKKRRLAAKLRLDGGDPKSGQRILDIGCGWGGLALTLAEQAPGASVLGVTLSQEQLTVARGRAQARGLADRVSFELCDYRDIKGSFDRIVSVGMFEHVGQPQYQAYFDTIARLLSEDGVAVIHSIGRKDEPGVTEPFIAKYIFPGGYIPALSQVLAPIERSGLWVTDVEVLRLHYAETLKAWRARFLAARDEIAALYDERFCRMWEYYLVVSELSFRGAGFMNVQVQLTRRADALPITRDYMMREEGLAEPDRVAAE